MAKYNNKTVNNICKNLERGLSQKDSALLVGISEDTFYDWKLKKPEFSESVERAIVKYKQRLITQVNLYSIKDGRLALEVLSRKWPYEFGKIQTLEVPKEEQKQKLPTEETVQTWIRTCKKMEEAKKAVASYYERKYNELLRVTAKKYPQIKINETYSSSNNAINNLQ